MASPLYPFILNMWIMKSYTEAQVRRAVTLGYITADESDVILATPQLP